MSGMNKAGLDLNNKAARAVMGGSVSNGRKTTRRTTLAGSTSME